MRKTIFSRLVTGYLLIFVFAMGVGMYAIIQLRHLETVTQSIITVDNRLIDFEQKLKDTFLSMVEYEKKFIIIEDDALLKQYSTIKSDFEKYLDELRLIADTSQIQKLLFDIEQSYNNYQSLFTKEITYLKSGKSYPQNSYKQKKELATNQIMNILRDLEYYNQQNTYNKIRKLAEAKVTASKIAIGIGLSSLILGIIISIIITRGITKPLSIMKNKTREIADGNFETNLQLSSPLEIKELSSAFNSMCTKLKELDKMKSDFFSLMSHELRTPLTTIKEGSNLLLESAKKGELMEKQKRLFTIISEESNRLINLVNSLMDLSKMEAGMMNFNFTEGDLGLLIKKAVTEIEPLSETKNISLETKINGNLPLLKIDNERILQVLRNLLGNALKYTPNGRNVDISAQTVEQGIKVSISDNGIGIPKKDLNSIFNKFQQSTITGSKKIMGTGLGLSIAKHIIDVHGGKIWAESTLGKGSIFTFILPA
jgi:two-component system sensor histidine kinase GlrK